MIDLYASGRTSWVEAEMCPCSSSPSKGKWTKLGGVTGGSLNWKLYSTLKMSGQLSVVGARMPTNCYVRVYYCMQLGGEEERDLLGTYYADPQSGRIEDGLYTGTVKLVSTLQRFEDYKLYQNLTLKRKDSVHDFAEKVLKLTGGEYVNTLHNVTVGQPNGSGHDVLYEFGTKAMDILQDLAALDNARLKVDEYGRLTFGGDVRALIINYNPLVLKPFDGVDVEESGFGTPNVTAVRQNVEVSVLKNSRVVRTYEKPFIGTAALDPSDEWSASKTSRKIVETYDLTETAKSYLTEEQLKNQYNYKAKLRLQRFGHGGTTKVTVRVPYSRVRLGMYVKAGDYKGTVTAIDMDLSRPMGVMKVTIADNLSEEVQSMNARASGIING